MDDWTKEPKVKPFKIKKKFNLLDFEERKKVIFEKLNKKLVLKR